MKISNIDHAVEMIDRRNRQLARSGLPHPPYRRTRRTKLNEVDLNRLDAGRKEQARKAEVRTRAYGQSLRNYHPLHDNDLTRPLWVLNAAARMLTGLT